MVESFLREECGLCSHCASFVIADKDTSPSTCTDLCLASCSTQGANDRCTVCFGLSSASYQRDHMLARLRESLAPYCMPRRMSNPASEAGDDPFSGAIADNYLAKESPTANLPWLIAVRARCAVAAATCYVATLAEPSASASASAGVRLRTAEEVYLRIKERVRSSLRRAVLDILHVAKGANPADADPVALSTQLHEEEAGYLGVHVLCLPPLDEDTDLTQLVPESFQAHLLRHKPHIQQSQRRILHPRKRFRGNDPTLKQGGDPRVNLELRVRRATQQRYGGEAPGGNDDQGLPRCSTAIPEYARAGPWSQPATEERTKKGVGGPSGTGEGRFSKTVKEQTALSPPNREWNIIISWLEKKTVLQWLEQECTPAASKQKHDHDLYIWLRQRHQSAVRQHTQEEPRATRPCSIHATAWRRPFYVQGTYTKARRDISQTPFYVPDAADAGDTGDGAADEARTTVRKGRSSVEEEICLPLARVGCGGISTRNNADEPENGAQGAERRPPSTGGTGAVVYGLCKFHASGREDMDVRMLLPPPSVAAASAALNVVVTGRPFVCEIFDAHRMPSKRDLDNVAKAINCQDEKTVVEASNRDGREGIAIGDNGWPTAIIPPSRYHGSNPRGVGTSSPLTLVSSVKFSCLQAETEGKVKYYGCICWSSVPIDSHEELRQKLGCSAWNKEGMEDAPCIYPLEIQQSTPLRVLHRRSSSTRTRQVLSLSARRLGDHWFRLRLSTSAGTYVKEFVHGDCGRSRPSVGGMLGGRADIVELDCEGIAV